MKGRTWRNVLRVAIVAIVTLAIWFAVGFSSVQRACAHDPRFACSPIRLSGNASANIVATNFTHQLTGGFESSRYAQGLPTGNGALFPTIATPLGQPQLFLMVNFHWEHEPQE